MEELRQELAQCVAFNNEMQDNVRGLQERAEHLKKDIEALLAMKMPITSLDTPKGDRNGAESGTGSPESVITEDGAAFV